MEKGRRTETEVQVTYQVERDRLPAGGLDKVVLVLVLVQALALAPAPVLVLTCFFPYSLQSQEKKACVTEEMRRSQNWP